MNKILLVGDDMEISTMLKNFLTSQCGRFHNGKQLDIPSRFPFGFAVLSVYRAERKDLI